MIVLSVHNVYQQPGGEDEVFRQEAQLLEKHGHQVVRFQAHNDDVAGKNPLALFGKTIFNGDIYQQLRELIRKNKPAIVHAHNTFPLISPAVYYAAAREGVPVVQTLHNYRLICPAATLYRADQPCERCMEASFPWPAVKYACYRGSRPTSAATAAMLTIHRLLGTYAKQLSTYIALSEFARTKFVQGGIPAAKLVVKPNFIDPDPGRGEGTGNYCMFVGRLIAEKGVRTLLDTWTRFAPPFDLEIAGDGDLAGEVRAAAERCPRIRWLGRLQKPELYARMKNAAALVVPSLWYEPFGVVVVEAFAMGVPVIASKSGALSDLVAHGRTGFQFEPGDPSDLAAQVAALRAELSAHSGMRDRARQEYERFYTGDQNYTLLMGIYREAIRRFTSGAKLEDAEASVQ